MANRTQLVVEILTDTAKAAQGLNETASKFEGFAKKAAGFVAGAFAVDKISEGVKAVVNNASDLEQAMGSVDAVFKGNAATIHSWAADTTDSIRLPQREFERLAAIIGVNLKTAGVPMDQLADKTRELIQVGADLAAQYGVPVSEAVAAVRSALVGEYDALQNLGIAINGDAVKRRALIDTHNDQAAAATEAAQATARMEIVLEGVGDAAGAAERETDTFSGQLEALKEKADNFAGSLGGPMLGALGGLVSSFGDVIPVLAPIAGLLTQFVTGIASLGTPVLAAAAGVTALVLAWGPLTGFLASGGAMIRSVATAFTGATSGIASATGGMGKLRAATDSVRTGAMSAGKALFDAVGGFAGIATGVATGALVGLVIYLGKLSAASNAAASSAKAITAALVEQEGNWNSTSEAAQAAAVTQSEAFQGLIEDGYTADDAVRALTGTWDDWTDVIHMNGQGTRNLNADTMDLVDAFKDEYQNITKNAAAQVEANKIIGEGSKAKEGAIYGANLMADSEAQAAKEAEKAAEEQKKLAEQIKLVQAAAEATTGNLLLKSVAAEAESAARAMDIFTAAMDDSLSRSTSYQSTTLGWADGIRAVGEAFKDAAEKGGINKDALAEWDIGALASTETGSKLAAALLDQSGKFAGFVTAAFEASGGVNNLDVALGAAHTAADQAYSDFTKLAEGAGLSAEQAQVLAGKLGIVNAQQIDDKVFEVISQDEAARQALAQIQASGIDPKTVTLVPDDKATPAIESALSYVDASGATVTIPIGATTAPAEATVDQFVGQKQATPDSFVSVRANITQANAVVTQFMSFKREVTIAVLGNLSNAQSQVTQFMSYQRTVTISVLGDTGPVNNAIRAVTNGSYSISVSIKANADEFYRVFNALPTTKTITQNVVQAPAPAPSVAPSFKVASLAPPGGLSLARMSATDSPSASPTAVSSASGGGTTIIVQGALDPDAVARQIGDLLRTRERRSGGITVAPVGSRLVS